MHVVLVARHHQRVVRLDAVQSVAVAPADGVDFRRSHVSSVVGADWARIGWLRMKNEEHAAMSGEMRPRLCICRKCRGEPVYRGEVEGEVDDRTMR